MNTSLFVTVHVSYRLPLSRFLQKKEKNKEKFSFENKTCWYTITCLQLFFEILCKLNVSTSHMFLHGNRLYRKKN